MIKMTLLKDKFFLRKYKLKFRKLIFDLKNLSIRTIKTISKKIKPILYILVFTGITCTVYLGLPKFFDYSLKKNLIKESLLLKNNLNLTANTKISYRVFPTPRLIISGADFNFNENNVNVQNATLRVVLKVSNMLNNKSFDYKKIIIRDANFEINLEKNFNIINLVKKNKKKIILKKNNFIINYSDQYLVRINNVNLIIGISELINKLKLSGNILDQKILMKFTTGPKEKYNLTARIPSIDLDFKLLLDNYQDASNFSGVINAEVLNNYLQFNFDKKKLNKINQGFARSKYFNGSFNGILALNPYFFLDLDVVLTSFQPGDFLNFVTTIDIGILKRINGTFNINFPNIFKGKVALENGNIFLKNFQINKNKTIFNLDAVLSWYKNQMKIDFALLREINTKRNLIKEIEIMGSITPSINEVKFTKIFLDKVELKEITVKEYEKIFRENTIKDSYQNIFKYWKIKRFFNIFKK